MDKGAKSITPNILSFSKLAYYKLKNSLSGFSSSSNISYKKGEAQGTATCS